jgi:periplasmic divalent cation tolerance protein
MSTDSPEPIIVVTTSDRLETLEQIAKDAVSQKLAACCQIVGPITSHYVWEGKPETSHEWQCQIKTTMSAYEKLEGLIKELHHYDEPEIIFFRIDGGSDSYLQWLCNSIDGS